MIKTIYLDMDGVLVDFRKGCEKLDAIEGRKVDWKKLRKEGSKFWAELEWQEGGQEFYKWLVKYCKDAKLDLCILSSVAYDAGVEGKKEWLANNCPEISSQNKYFVHQGREKARYANNTALLIDDFGKNIEAFMSAGGAGVKYDNGPQAKEDILGII